MRDRWLVEFPNYSKARPVEELPAGSSGNEFLTRFVARHRPCVVRAAAIEWPAVRKWSIDFLRAHASDDVLVDVSTHPLAEEIGVPIRPRTRKVSMTDFLALLRSAEPAFVQAYYMPPTVFSALVGDLGVLAFFDPNPYPPRMSADRLFMSRAGYTDWHTHSADETLTVQIRGAKELLLLSPDRATHDALLPAARYGAWKYPRGRWSATFATLVPWRVRLDPGDVLYIPMNWWHVAEAEDDQLNVTLARVFRTPLEWQADLRLPNVRRSLGLGMVVGAWSSLRSRSLRPLVQVARMAVTTAFGFPLSLLRHGSVEHW